MSDLHVAEVTRTTRRTPGMVRVTFGGDGLRAFRTTGIGDEFVVDDSSCLTTNREPSEVSANRSFNSIVMGWWLGRRFLMKKKMGSGATPPTKTSI